MAIESLSSLAPLSAWPRSASAGGDGEAGGGGFAGVLQGVLGQNAAASATADAAIRDLATGQAQDLHSVSLAVAQADLSFRLILEMRNRLTDAFQEIQRMQV